ncbi:copper chaperone PCu(A)C [Solimonas variicoloris]|uniref:copper chaperone PCu(A)C n=1 Tax=Solimonas variicoloris TaxID=254408 RepID=UPI00035EC7A4|nr:copper chaperone PCu(A)C [Solimonas variicoloris]
MRTFIRFAAVLAVLCGSTLAQAADPVSVVSPWLRATPPGASVAGGYATFRNDGDAPRRVLSVTVEPALAASAAIHSMSHEGGVMRMREVDSLELPAHGSVSLAPGGLHLMLMGLKQPLTAGQSQRLQFVLDDGTRLSVDFPVRDSAP